MPIPELFKDVYDVHRKVGTKLYLIPPNCLFVSLGITCIRLSSLHKACMPCHKARHGTTGTTGSTGACIGTSDPVLPSLRVTTTIIPNWVQMCILLPPQINTYILGALGINSTLDELRSKLGLSLGDSSLKQFGFLMKEYDITWAYAPWHKQFLTGGEWLLGGCLCLCLLASC